MRRALAITYMCASFSAIVGLITYYAWHNNAPTWFLAPASIGGLIVGTFAVVVTKCPR